MKIKVYTKDYCPYCNQVEAYLNEKELAYEKIDVSNRLDIYEALKKKTGHHTVPQVFINDQFIGGADDFKAYVLASKL
jgi:glutaredoxin 3